MGHLVRNLIKHIPHKVGLFGYFPLSLASLKGYYLFKVPHITPSRQCQCLIVSYLIVLINYPRTPARMAGVLLLTSGQILLQLILSTVGLLSSCSFFTARAFTSSVQCAAFISIYLSNCWFTTLFLFHRKERVGRTE